MESDEVVLRNVGYCFVADCPSKRTSGAGVVNELHFFTFPDKTKFPVIRHQWALFCARDDGSGGLLEPGEQRICCKHFRETDLVKYSTNKRKDKRKPLTYWRLLDDTICPSLFPPNNHPISSSVADPEIRNQPQEDVLTVLSIMDCENVDDSEWTLLLPDHDQPSTGSLCLLDTFELLKDHTQGEHGRWRSEIQERHGTQFLTVYDSYNGQPDTANHLQWDLRKIVFDEELRCSVFVASIPCPITPFEVPVFPTSTALLDKFLQDFEWAPLCEAVFTSYPPEKSCSVFRGLRGSYCPECARSLKVAKASERKNQLQKEVTSLKPKKGTCFKNMTVEELREQCRSMSQVNSKLKKQLNRAQARLQRQDVEMDLHKQEPEIFA